MRILFTAAPFHGHVNALLPLARAAGRAGHDVVFATGADLAEGVATRGLKVWSVGPTGTESGTPMSLDEFWETAGRRAADLIPRVADWRPDLVVSEELELGGPIVAARLRTQLVVHGLGIAAAGDPVAFAPDLEALGRRWDAPDLASAYLSAAYVSVRPPSLGAEEPTTRPTLRMRPGLGEPSPGQTLPEWILALPHDRLVHLTLGTVFHQRRPDAMRNAIAGLRELPLNVVVTVGPGVATDSFGPQPAHVVVSHYIPHSLLLPRCDLVVSQGGAGILLGALAHGLPQLVLPQGADQYANGAAVHRAGAGLALDDEDVAPEVIAAAAQELLTDSRFRTAAAAMRHEIESMPTADDVVRHLEEMLARGLAMDRQQ